MANFPKESELQLLRSHSPQERSHTSTERDILFAQEPSNDPRTRTWTISVGLVIASAIFPVVVFSLWVASPGIKDTIFMTFSGARIGGKFSQPEAKLIDVACSAVLAPLIMTGLNFLWFGSARVSTFNDQRPSDRAGIPLSTLVAVSTSTSGTYDPLNIRSLLRGKTHRLYLLAALTLLSAFSKTALSNLIAYEAFPEEHANQQKIVLRYLSDRAINSTSLMHQIFSMDPKTAFGFSREQQADIASQVTGLLTGLSFVSARTYLNDSTYVCVNSTENAMDRLPPNVVGLHHVPGFRLSVDCIPDLPSSVNISTSGPYTTVISTLWDNAPLLDGWESRKFNARYSGLPQDMQGSMDDEYPFAAFSMDATEVYLGSLVPSDRSNRTFFSPYGDIRPKAIDMKSSGFNGTKAVMSVYGIRCALRRQEGFLEYMRASDQSWSISTAEFSNKMQKVPSFLVRWQVILNYRSPRSTVAGIGPALAKTAGSNFDGQPDCSHNDTNCYYNTTDYSLLALNYLYASAEIMKKVYEVAAADKSRDEPDFSYHCYNTIVEDRYRITYIPGLLLTGLRSEFSSSGYLTADCGQR
ncbi:uncharacterized protein LTHEOB_4482 [Lasiodiplodia theobromae]|uniref:uncharacterized protein n=1 Tax=Lasiodiplodia theobromae TaxID=45133 RepID=UPI0015C2F281|nr:uncharacterized protein LTHEOB_4482 [Lasiodiplodia theobromae]KAF4545830.1 hypothetical protein LTHEOB_4482 [Lasiodiplodia theobromae]